MTDMTEAVAAWARTEAEKRYPEGDGVLSRAAVDLERAGFAAGVKLLADRLLSDEAAWAAARRANPLLGVYTPLYRDRAFNDARAALVAGLAAVTEGSK